MGLRKESRSRDGRFPAASSACVRRRVASIVCSSSPLLDLPPRALVEVADGRQSLGNRFFPIPVQENSGEHRKMS